MDLLHEITRCPNIQHCYATHQSTHPCASIISVQKNAHPGHMDQHQVPEPWSGDIAHAPILFLSSNPSIDENSSQEHQEEFPLWSWTDEQIADFFMHRYGGGQKQWIKEGRYSLLRNGSYAPRAVKFWSSVRKRAEELLERDVNDGVDYALTEVVHCKSKREYGVREAQAECAKRYLRHIVELSGARVIVVLGTLAKEAVKNEWKLPDERVLGPQHMGKQQRYIVFLPHPNARGPRTFEKYVDKDKLQELRAFLRQG